MSTRPVGIDVACDSCGYNLRGLAGEWIRCPECGRRRSWESIEWVRKQREADAESLARALEVRRNQVRTTRAETGANLCALATGGFLIAGVLRLVGREFWTGILRPLTMTSASIWLVGIVAFCWTCGRRPGYARAFLRHQMFAIPTVVLNILFVIAVSVLGFALHAWLEGPPAGILVLTLAAPFAVWKLKPFAALSRRARAEIEKIVR